MARWDFYFSRKRFFNPQWRLGAGGSKPGFWWPGPPLFSVLYHHLVWCAWCWYFSVSAFSSQHVNFLSSAGWKRDDFWVCGVGVGRPNYSLTDFQTVPLCSFLLPYSIFCGTCYRQTLAFFGLCRVNWFACHQ